MTTKDNNFQQIGFSVASRLKHVRLMEVPDELLQIITSSTDADIDKPVLKFKSAAAIDAGTMSLARTPATSNVKDGILHLCSQDKAWAIKQVSTSNSVYVIQPSAEINTLELEPATRGDMSITSNDDGDVNIKDDNTSGSRSSVTSGSVTAVSQVRNFLELHPVKIDEFETANSILDLVPVFEPTDDGETIQQAQQSLKPAVSLAVVADSIAAPDPVIDNICTQLCIFEHLTSEQETLGTTTETPPTAGVQRVDRHQRQCHLPSPMALLNVWSKIVEGCAIEMIKLDHALDVDRIIDAAFPPSSDTIDQKMARVLLRPEGTFDRLGVVQYTNDDSIEDTTTYDKQTKTSQRDSEHSTSMNRAVELVATAAAIPRKGLRYLKPVETTQFTANLILRAKAYGHHFSPTHDNEDPDPSKGVGGSEIQIETFITRWTQLVPSSFVKFCTLDQLRSYHGSSSSVASIRSVDGQTLVHWNDGHRDNNDNNSKNKIRDLLLGNLLVGRGLGSSSASTTTGVGTNASNASGVRPSSTTTPATNATTGNRKWHEKFGAQRSLKK